MEGLRQSNKGFTLVEICVTFVLVSILASITTFSLVAWQHNSQFNKMEQNAELVYMAARNKLAIYNANKVTYNNKSVFCSIEDYKKYVKNESSLKEDCSEAYLLFKLISEYIYDKTILEAYIYIEFDSNCNIKSVYYSNRTLFFNNGIIKQEYNDASKRYDDNIGMYMP